MESPRRLELPCPTCGKRTAHRVLAGRSSARAFEGTVRCEACGLTHQATARRKARVSVDLIVSREAESEKQRLTFLADEWVRVGDELEMPAGRLLVAALDTKAGARVERALAADLATLWAKAYDVVRVKVSLNLGRETASRTLLLDPDDEVSVGETVRLGDLEATVGVIKTGTRRVRRGSVKARDVVRVYAKARPEPERARAPLRRLPPRGPRQPT